MRECSRICIALWQRGQGGPSPSKIVIKPLLLAILVLHEDRDILRGMPVRFNAPLFHLRWAALYLLVEYPSLSDFLLIIAIHTVIRS